MEDEIRVKDQKMINMQIMEHGANPVYMPKCNFEVRKRMRAYFVMVVRFLQKLVANYLILEANFL